MFTHFYFTSEYISDMAGYKKGGLRSEPPRSQKKIYETENFLPHEKKSFKNTKML